MKMLFATGGTGGHIMPAIAIREAAMAAGHEVIFIHGGQPIEEKICAQYKVQTRVLPAMAFTGKSLVQKLRVLLVAPFRIWSAIKILKAENPAVVVGFGGYVSFIPVLAAKLLGIPTAIQEQNGSLGLANRILSKFVTRAFIPEGCQFAGISKRCTVVVLNNPVRDEFRLLAPWRLGGGRVRILAIGGSQGAVTLNSAVIGAITRLAAEGLQLTVTHQTGARDLERIEELVRKRELDEYRCLSFTQEMPKLLENANLVISRAGAMSVAEIGAAGRPVVFVPLNIARAHQRENVNILERAGACEVVIQDNELENKLFVALRRILTQDNVLQRMAEAAGSLRGRFDTADRFVSELVKISENVR